MSDVEEFMNRVENDLNSLSIALRALEKKIDEPISDGDADTLAPYSDSDVESDLVEFKNALQKLQAARRDMYQFNASRKREAQFDSLNVMSRIATVAAELNRNTEKLVEQCEYLEKTRQNLDDINGENNLLKTLTQFEDNLSALGTYDEKIRSASEEAAANVKDMQDAIDSRVNDAIKLEKELLFTSQELNRIARNFSAPMQQPPAAASNVDDGSAAAICKKIADIIYDEENRSVFKQMISMQITPDERNSLSPALNDKLNVCVHGFNYYLKIYSKIRKIFDETYGN